MIYLCVKDGIAFVWNADDWLELRKHHRIVGQLIGSIASQPQQETYLGLPMTLLPEETSLLVEKGIATTVQYPLLTKQPTEDIKKQYEAYIEEITKEQVDIAKEERKKIIIKNIDHILEGKRQRLMGLHKNLRKKRKTGDSSQPENRAGIVTEEASAEHENIGESGREGKVSCPEKIDECGRKGNSSGLESGREVDTSGFDKIGGDVDTLASKNGEVGIFVLEKTDNSSSKKITGIENEIENMEIDTDTAAVAPEFDVGKISKEIVMEEEFAKIRPLDPSNIMIQNFMECPWIKNDEMEIVEWQLPKTYLKKLRYQAFKALWEKGYYITSGSKFGVDFLVYPGDPVKFHAFFLVKCLGRSTCIPATQLISCGRLGHSVRKTLVFAFFDDDDGEVEFVSLNWAME